LNHIPEAIEVVNKILEFEAEDDEAIALKTKCVYIQSQLLSEIEAINTKLEAEVSVEKRIGHLHQIAQKLSELAK